MNPDKIIYSLRVALGILTLCILLSSAAPVPAAQAPSPVFLYPNVEKNATLKADCIKNMAEIVSVTPAPASADAEMLARLTYVEYSGESDTEAAMVMWCVLNRVDEGGGAVDAVITAPHQFAYSARSPVTERLLALAEDVLARWKSGGEGRVLPPGYTQFRGDGTHNHYYKTFRDAQRGVNQYGGGADSPYDT